MKINSLNLIAFGNFADVSIDLSGPGLHIVYGPNEAGKTTARAAVTDLLYGIGNRTSFDFFHPANKLQIGGTLLEQNGDEISVIRHKRNKNNLLDRSSDTPMDENKWRELLRNLSREEFSSMFTLGWEQLLSETARLVERGGAFNETVFAAGLGIQEIDGIIKKLDADAAKLFAPRASARSINESLKKYNELKKEIATLSLKPSYYDERCKQLDKTKKQEQKYLAEKTDLENKKLHLSTLRAILPNLAKRQVMAEKRDSLALDNILPRSLAQKIEEKLNEKNTLTGNISSRKSEIANHDIRLAAIAVDEDLLREGENIDLLSENILAYIQGIQDRVGLAEKLSKNEQKAGQLLTAILKHPADPEEIDKFRIILADQNLLTQAYETWVSAQTDYDTANGHLEELEFDIENNQEVLQHIPEYQNTAQLSSTIESLLPKGDLDALLSDLSFRLTAAHDAMSAAASKLGFDPQQCDAVMKKPSPSEDEIQKMLDLIREYEGRSFALEKQLASAEERKDSKELQLKTHDEMKELPSEEELKQIRSLREKDWESIKASWLENKVVTGSGFKYSTNADLAEGYESNVISADATVDKLWEAADKTAQRNSLEKDLANIAEEINTITLSIGDNQEKLENEFRTWRNRWPGISIPDSHSELDNWKNHFIEFCKLYDSHSQIKLEHRSVFKERFRSCNLLADILQNINKDHITSGNLTALILEARETLANLKADADQRRDCQNSIKTLQQNVSKVKIQLDKADEARSVACKRFQDILQGYIPNIDSVEDAKWLLSQLSTLSNIIKDIDSLKGRIGGIDNRSHQFQETISAITEKLPSFTQNSPDMTARELVASLKTAREANATYLAILDTKEKAEDDLRQFTVKYDRCESELADLLQNSSSTDIENLSEQVERSLSFYSLDDDIEKINDDLINQTGGRPLSEIDKESAEQNIDEINREINDVDLEITRLGEQLNDIQEHRINLESEINKMNGSGDAASEAALAETYLASLAEESEKYACLLLAKYITSEAVHRYSAKHQNPLLLRASDYFREITDNRYQQISVDTDEKGDKLLSAITNDAEQKNLKQLSDGTRDQLYFALRVAIIAESIERIGDMPVILDDVLINFDDTRSAAALRCLNKLSQSTQVLLFTHHRHLLSLAEQSLGSGVPQIHELNYN